MEHLIFEKPNCTIGYRDSLSDGNDDEIFV